MTSLRLAVIGAGPIGLAAAHAAVARGFEVVVLEQGEVGDALRRWGPTRLFTPLGMNLPPGARALVPDLPPDDALLTGPELADHVLAPLAAPLGARLRTQHRVLSVGRARLTRGELFGHPLRAERPFRLLVENARGEKILEADRVIDASGVYGQPRWLGAGGLPALGERGLGERVVRTLGALHQRRDELVGRRILLVGHGHSAANAIQVLDGWAREHAGTRLVWAVRTGHARPCVAIAGDPLPERRQIVDGANALAERPPPHLVVERRAAVEAIGVAGAELAVSLAGGRAHTVDAIVALTGYRPDTSLWTELSLEVAPASEGMARLERAVRDVRDCLSVPRVSAADLASGEPNFFVAGSKSYGRAETFLLANGYAQLQTIVDQL
jgi:thioredoxin reductase